MKRKLIFACVFSLLLLSYAYAEDDKPFSGGIFLGGRAININHQSATFNQYNEITPGVFGGGYLQYQDDKKGYYLNADGAYLGEDDMYMKLKGGKWGSFKYSLYYTEFPHNLGFQNKSLFATPGSTSQTFFGNGSTNGVTTISRWGSQSFDYKIVRKDVGGSFDLSALKPFFISVDANRLEREGQIPWVGTSGQASFKAVEFAAPVDNYTSNINGLVGWKNKQFYLAFSGGWSQFTNDVELTRFRDPFTTGTTVSNGITVGPPDNKSYNVKFTGTAKLPLTSTFALNLGYQRNTSDSTLLRGIDTGTSPFVQALAVNRTAFRGDIKYWNVNATLTSNPWKNLNTKLYYSYVDKENDSTPILFATANNAIGGEINTFQRNTYGAEASYRFTQKLKGILGYEYSDLRRRTKEVESEETASGEAPPGFHATEFQYPDTWDQKWTAQMVYNPIDWLGTRIKYQKLYRNTHFTNVAADNPTDLQAVFTASMQNQFRRFDIGDRVQDMVKLTADLTPIKDLDVTVEYAYKRNIFSKDNTLGYRDMNSNEFIVDASYGWKDIKFFLFFDYDYSYINQLSRQGAGAAGQSPLIFAPPTTTNFNWNADLKNDNYAYGLGTSLPILKNQLKNKLNFIVQYDFEKNNGTADFTSQAFTTAVSANGYNNSNIGIPNWGDYTRQSISARLKYDLNRNLGLMFGYVYSQFKTNDGQFAGYSYVPQNPATGAFQSMLLSGAYANQNQNYNANVFYLKAMYKF